MTGDPPADDDATVVPPIQAFKAALPAHIAQRLASSAQIIAALREALDRGWTIPALAGHCLGAVGRNAERPAGIVHYQLIQAAKADPPTPVYRPVRIGARVPPSCVRCHIPTWVSTLSGTPLCALCLVAGPVIDGTRPAVTPPAQARAQIDAIRHRPPDAPATEDDNTQP